MHHLLSDIERNTFYLFDWADIVTDIREQFPLDRNITRRIAGDLGIPHPRIAHSSAPLVMTTDFLVDVYVGGRLIQLARAVKPADELEKPRVIEKLEMERRYWELQGVDWGIITERDIPEAMVRNIVWVHSYAEIDQIKQPYEGYFSEKARLVFQELPSHPGPTLRQFCADMDLRFSMSAGDCLLLVRHMLAKKMIVCPMDRPIDDSTPLHQFRLSQRESMRASG
ncbi:TnsA endonuclease C-terminal domain-containing protein [Acidithiobacillus sp. AMEEHan]|uniref:TnsA endonuclease C-terminal domain-containing protein n=1 Tax=Acidithiobacillus sp. AMEEHan TaxID=2994951 RepID=UPI0027E44452|nr:TnsA endonuclease C-terminal domain-containing protein [Acidithiobacillus sp. AMEEHan]